MIELNQIPYEVTNRVTNEHGVREQVRKQVRLKLVYVRLFS